MALPELLKTIAVWCAAIAEGLGVGVIIVFALYALVLGAARLPQRESPDQVFHQVRRRLGRGILLGLEFLVAGDIIHTVAVDLTFRTVGVLAVIVLIRTFLSITLEVELTGKWPWDKGAQGPT